jgi:hypothetical protein
LHLFWFGRFAHNIMNNETDIYQLLLSWDWPIDAQLTVFLSGAGFITPLIVWALCIRYSRKAANVDRGDAP